MHPQQDKKPSKIKGPAISLQTFQTPSFLSSHPLSSLPTLAKSSSWGLFNLISKLPQASVFLFKHHLSFLSKKKCKEKPSITSFLLVLGSTLPMRNWSCTTFVTKPLPGHALHLLYQKLIFTNLIPGNYLVGFKLKGFLFCAHAI